MRNIWAWTSPSHRVRVFCGQLSGTKCPPDPTWCTTDFPDTPPGVLVESLNDTKLPNNIHSHFSPNWLKLMSGCKQPGMAIILLSLLMCSFLQLTLEFIRFFENQYWFQFLNNGSWLLKINTISVNLLIQRVYQWRQHVSPNPLMTRWSWITSLLQKKFGA